jgi:hypothetical protein
VASGLLWFGLVWFDFALLTLTSTVNSQQSTVNSQQASVRPEDWRATNCVTNPGNQNLQDECATFKHAAK